MPATASPGNGCCSLISYSSDNKATGMRLAATKNATKNARATYLHVHSMSVRLP